MFIFFKCLDLLTTTRYYLFAQTDLLLLAIANQIFMENKEWIIV